MGYEKSGYDTREIKILVETNPKLCILGET